MQPLDAPLARSSWQTLSSWWEQQIRSRPFLIRLRSWEYWPFAVVYAPVFLYYGWLSLRARSWFFFSASNPGIETGGMRGESKVETLNRIGAAYKPKTLFFSQPQATITNLLNQMMLAGFWFPIIAKPDRGERGFRVERLTTEAELTEYLQTNHQNLIVQEYVDEPLELGVFYYRFPGEGTGTVSSIVVKEFLSVTGNGRQSIRQLLAQNERAVLQQAVLDQRYGKDLDEVLPTGEQRVLMPIGNHCRGTAFLNGNHLITPELTAVFDRIAADIDGFYYGRFDLRCRSVAHLLRGETIRIMELNGAGAEPAHIYQPGFSIWEGWRVLLRHWQVLYQISSENHRRGIPYMTFPEAWGFYQRSRADKKLQP